MSEYLSLPFERHEPAIEPVNHLGEEERDPLEDYLLWRRDFLKMVEAWNESETEARAQEDVVLTGLASGKQGVLGAEKLQALQQSLAGGVSTQFFTLLQNPFWVGAMIISFHSLECGGDGIEVSKDMPGGEHLERYQLEKLHEREQHLRVRQQLAVA